MPCKRNDLSKSKQMMNKITAPLNTLTTRTFTFHTNMSHVRSNLKGRLRLNHLCKQAKELKWYFLSSLEGKLINRNIDLPQVDLLNFNFFMLDRKAG